MKRTIKVMLLIFCILVTVSSAVFSVAASEFQTVITGEKELNIQPSDKNCGYVYVDAEVPNGWGGSVQIRFHSKSTGKDYSCQMSYIENQYHTGIYLPFGTYKVSAEIPEDDLCLIKFKDASQETIQVKKGSSLQIVLEAVDNPDFSFEIPPSQETITPPMPQEQYTDLPTQATESETVPATISPNEDLQIIQQEKSPEWLKGLAVTLVLILFIAVIAYTVHEYRQMRDS